MKHFMAMVFCGVVSGWTVARLSHAGRHCWIGCPDPVVTDSWEKIRADWNVGITQPAAASTFGPYGYFNSCLDGDHFRSLRPSPFCVESRWVHVGGGSQAGGEDIQQCVRFESRYATLALNSVRKVCLENRTTHIGGGQETGEDITTCVRYGMQTVHLPSSPELTVVKYFSTGQPGAGSNIVIPQFKKRYDVPACKF